MSRALKPYLKCKDSDLPWPEKISGRLTKKRAKCSFREVDERSSTVQEMMLSVSHITGTTPPSQKNSTTFKAQSGHSQLRSIQRCFLEFLSHSNRVKTRSKYVRFLTKKIRFIHINIRAKRQFIKLLEKQKDAIIHNAVTSDIDPSIRLKPSNIGRRDNVCGEHCGHHDSKAPEDQDLLKEIPAEED